MSIDKDHKIIELEQADSDWIAHHLHKLRLYLENKSGQKINDIPEPKFLDQYFNIALQDQKRGDLSEDDLINMFGSGFGQYFEEKASFQWIIYSDKHGNDLAVKNNETGVIGFPLSSTAKRLTDEFAGTFDGIFLTLTDNTTII